MRDSRRAANFRCSAPRCSPPPSGPRWRVRRPCALRWIDMSLTSINWFRYASPVSFFPMAQRLTRWFGAAAALLAVVGLWLGLVVAPTDAQQGDAYRIIFIHVPAAWMSMFIYLVMAGWCGMSLTLNARLS